MPKPGDIMHVSPQWHTKGKVEPYAPDTADNLRTKKGQQRKKNRPGRLEREALARKLGLKKG